MPSAMTNRPLAEHGQSARSAYHLRDGGFLQVEHIVVKSRSGCRFVAANGLAQGRQATIDEKSLGAV
jgi:hypothetical protein